LIDTASHGLVDLGFVDHYALMDAVRRHANERAAIEPLPVPPLRSAAAPEPTETAGADPMPEPTGERSDSTRTDGGAADHEHRGDRSTTPAVTDPAVSAPAVATPVDDGVGLDALESGKARSERRPKPAAARSRNAPNRSSKTTTRSAATSKQSSRSESAAASTAAPTERLPLRRDRREEILEQLRQGPASAQELAELFGISREGVLRWLRLLEADGTIHSTAAARTSRTNRWVLSEKKTVESPGDGENPSETGYS
jgi:predicted transcriptional regulator